MDVARLLSITLLLLATSGCNVVHRHQAKKSCFRDTPQEPAGTVVIGGHVQHPQRLVLDRANFSLRELVLLGGSVPKGFTSANSNPIVEQVLNLLDNSELEVSKGNFDASKFNVQAKALSNLDRTSASILSGLGGHLAIANRNTPQKEEAMQKFRAQKAILLAGLKRENSIGVKTDESYVVILRRKEASGNSNYFFPYELVSNGIVGEIQLMDGDLVQVERLSDTSLGTSTLPSRRAPRYLIRGNAEVEGDFQEQIVIKNLLKNRLSESSIKGRTDRVVLLTRNSSSGLGRDFFVFPVSWMNDANKVGGNRVVDGDIFVDTTTLKIPMVLPGVISSARKEIQRKVREQPTLPKPKRNTLVRNMDSFFRNTLYRIGL